MDLWMATASNRDPSRAGRNGSSSASTPRWSRSLRSSAHWRSPCGLGAPSSPSTHRDGRITLGHAGHRPAGTPGVHPRGLPDVLIGRSIVEAGPPADALIRAAERVGGELLVIGRRGLGTAASSLGSTSEAVLDVAGIPVLIVPSRCSTDTVAAAASGRSAASPSVPSSDVAE